MPRSIATSTATTYLCSPRMLTSSNFVTREQLYPKMTRTSYSIQKQSLSIYCTGSRIPAVGQRCPARSNCATSICSFGCMKTIRLLPMDATDGLPTSLHVLLASGNTIDESGAYGTYREVGSLNPVIIIVFCIRERSKSKLLQSYCYEKYSSVGENSNSFVIFVWFCAKRSANELPPTIVY